MTTSATIVYHAISLWIPATWGTVAFLLLRKSRNEPLVLRPSRAERRFLRRSKRHDRLLKASADRSEDAD